MVRGATLLSLLLLAALVSEPARAGEPDWFTRVKEKGLTAACEEDVALHEKGVLSDSLHVGECYYRLSRWEEGLAVFRGLLSSPDRNYAAMAQVRVGEGLFHLGKAAEAKAAFETCLTEHPEAWLDESVPDLCRAWLRKLAGELAPPAEPPAVEPEVEALKKEVKELTERLEELKRILRELTGAK
jgi:tetratricopeptide (TPR) repeat protein